MKFHNIKEERQIFLLRHGHRQEISPGSFGHEISLTEEGKRASENRGKHFNIGRWGEVHSSPLLRCKETAKHFLQGANQNVPVKLSKILGDPGPFVSEPEAAGSIFLKSTLQEIIQQMISNQVPFGMRTLHEGTKLFVNYLKCINEFPCLMISHDIIIALLYSYFFKTRKNQLYIPDYLNGLRLILCSDMLTIFFQDEQVSHPLIQFSG